MNVAISLSSEIDRPVQNIQTNFFGTLWIQLTAEGTHLCSKKGREPNPFMLASYACLEFPGIFVVKTTCE
jgi:hypothetical protein